MVNLLHAEWHKMVGNRWTIGLLLWVFPVGALAFVLGMSLMAFVNPITRENLFLVTWQEAFLLPWSFINNPFGAMLLLAFTSVTFAGEYQWSTWKNILPRQQRSRIIMAKFINLAALIFFTFLLTSLIFGMGFGLMAAISGNDYIAGLTSENALDFIFQYAQEASLAFTSIIIASIYAALAAIFMRSILGGTLVGIGLALVDPLFFGMIGWWAKIFDAMILLHLGRISPFYNIGNIKSWIRTEQASLSLESAFQAFGEAVPIDSLGFSILMLTIWLVGGIGLVLFLFQRQDITS